MSENDKPQGSGEGAGKAPSKAKRTRKTLVRKTRYLALEPRIVFDGALAADIVDKTAQTAADASKPVGATAAESDKTLPAVDWTQTAAPATASDVKSVAVPGTPDAAAADRAAADKAAADKAAADRPQGVLEPVSARSGGEILFIDTSIAGYQQLVAGVRSGVEVVLLDPARDGFAQITEALAGRQNVDAVHLVTHGSVGEIALGNTEMTALSVAQHGADMAAWKASLSPGADFLIYGCEAGQGLAGQSLLTQLSALTGADVAASDNLTGGGPLGGDWNLEVTQGTIVTRPFADSATLAQFSAVLAQPVVDLNGADLNVTDTFGGTAAIDVYSFNRSGVGGSAMTDTVTAGMGWLTPAGATSGWVEFDAAPSGGTNSENNPITAHVQVKANPGVGTGTSGNVLMIEGHSDLPQDYIQRAINLQPYTSAQVSFSYVFVNASAGQDFIQLQVSNNGGANFSTLATYSSSASTGVTTSGSATNVDISAYVSENTVVRLQVSSGFGGTTDKFYLDNVKITAGGNNYASAFTESGTAVQLMDTNATFSSSNTTTSATVKITNWKSGDSLAYATTSGIAGSLSPDGSTLTLTGSGDANFLAALKAVRYSNASLNPDATTRDITVTATDGTTPSATVRAYVKVIPVNNPIVANPEVFTLAAGQTTQTGNILADGGYGKDYDPDGVVTFDSLLAAPKFGTVAINTDGTFTYNYTGGPVPVGGIADTFTYKLISVAQVPGVNYEFWANNSTLTSLIGTGPTGFPTTTPDYTGFSSTYNVDQAVRDYSAAKGLTPNFDNFVIRYSSGLTVKTGGNYTFYSGSDDGSIVYVDGQMVVNNDGLHSFQTVTGSTIYLSPGLHSIEVRFNERGGQETLTVSYSGADTSGLVTDLGRQSGVLANEFATATATILIPETSAPPRVALGTTVSVIDDFKTQTYTNTSSTSTFGWVAPWIETSDDASATAAGGQIKVVTDTADFKLQIQNATGTNVSITRPVDLIGNAGVGATRVGTQLQFAYDRTP
ncbi:MAG: DUF4347 domain-containing protein, partial [Betaproteobacteria bacterium]